MWPFLRAIPDGTITATASSFKHVQGTLICLAWGAHSFAANVAASCVKLDAVAKALWRKARTVNPASQWARECGRMAIDLVPRRDGAALSAATVRQRPQ